MPISRVGQSSQTRACQPVAEPDNEIVLPVKNGAVLEANLIDIVDRYRDRRQGPTTRPGMRGSPSNSRLWDLSRTAPDR